MNVNEAVERIKAISIDDESLERYVLLDNIKSSLTDTQYDLLKMRLNGLSYSAIAELTNTPKTTVYRKLKAIYRVQIKEQWYTMYVYDLISVAKNDISKALKENRRVYLFNQETGSVDLLERYSIHMGHIVVGDKIITNNSEREESAEQIAYETYDNVSDPGTTRLIIEY